MVRVKVLTQHGKILWEGVMPQAPANGDVFRIDKVVHVLHERTWTPEDKETDVWLMSVEHGVLK